MSHAGSPLLAQATVPADAVPAAGDAESETPPAATTAESADDGKQDDGNQDDGNQDDGNQGDGNQGDNAEQKENAKRKPEIHVIYVGDIDLLSSEFLMLRAQPDAQFPWDFDNVPFVLNIVDSLANDESLVEIRKRKTRHSTLKMVEMQTDEARKTR